MARGSIVPKGSGKHMIRVYLGTDPETGTRKWYNETVHGSRKKAQQRLTEVLRSQDKGAFRAPTKQTLSQYLHEWMNHKEGEIRARTAWDYRGLLERYIHEQPKGYPVLSLFPLTKLQPKHFNNLFRHMVEECGLAHRTVSYLRTVLRMALQAAVVDGRLGMNPVQYSKVWKRRVEGTDVLAADKGEGKHKINAMTQAEADRFLEAAKECRLHALWHVLLLGGIRPSEAFGLSWDAVDFDASEITVRQTVVMKGVDLDRHPEGWTFAPVKTASSRRTIVMPLRAMAALRKWRAEQAAERLQLGAEYRDHNLVFGTTFGSPLDLSNVYERHFRAVMARAGLGEWRTVVYRKKERRRFFPSYRIYDLRHTCATLLIANGEDVKAVSERLGHKTVVITYDFYTHVLPSTKTAIAARLDAMFGG